MSDADPRAPARAEARPLAGLKVLLIEDMASLRMVYRTELIHAGAEVRVAATAAEGRAAFRERPVPVVLLDLALPDGDGLTLMRDLRALRSDLRIVVITAHGGVNRAVQAMRAGAHDFLVKPFDGERLVAATRSAAQSLTPPGRRPRALSHGLGAMVGSSAVMASVASALAAAAPAMAPVLISGEPGTGKDLAARLLHALSGRASGPFVRIDCGEASPAEMEAALFAGTGAFHGEQEATLYLADLPALPLPLQHRLLPLLRQDGLGGPAQALTRRPRGRVRLVAGVTGDPEAALAEGRLDPGLYRVLEVFRLALPPLRHRGRDAVDIARAALAHFAQDAGKRFDGLSAPVEELFCHLPWPDNVRELLQLLRHIVAVQPGGIVSLDMLPDALVPPALRGLDRTPVLARPAPVPGPALTDLPSRLGTDAAVRSLVGLPLAEIERLVIEATIDAEAGSLPRAARRLGLAPSTLYRKRQGWTQGPPPDDPA
jgi:DNA-binding NtrC family response regulator